MAKVLNVNPNRMELLRLKTRLVVARRSHKLLKDKQDALNKEFLQRARVVKELRDKVEEELLACYASFQLARAQVLPQMLEQSLLCAGGETQVKVRYRNVMSVNVPEFEILEQVAQLRYGLAHSPGSLDVALERFSSVMPKLVQLAAQEKALRLMALEIERTRRRVNALEHVLIPNYQETIRSISMKLGEAERSNQSRLMVIKEIVRSH